MYNLFNYDTMERVSRELEIILLAIESSKHKKELFKKLIKELLEKGNEDRLKDYIAYGQIQKVNTFNINDTIVFGTDAYYSTEKSNYNTVKSNEETMEALRKAGSLCEEETGVSGIIVDFDLIENMCLVEVCMHDPNDDIVIKCIWKLNTYSLKVLSF